MSQHEASRIAQEAQRRLRLRRAAKFALPTAAALGAGAAIAVAAIPSNDGTITGCYLTKPVPPLRYGQLRVIDTAKPPQLPTGGPNDEAACLPDESTISWNQSGPAGPQGAAGTIGGQGPPGTPGLPGAPGELLPVVQFGFDNSAGKMFLKLEGIKGESSDKRHSGDFEISSFSFGGGNTQAHGSGGGAGKTSFSSFTITKTLDKASPLLQKAAITGQHYKEAVIYFGRKSSKGQPDYLEVKLDNVLISSYQTGGHSGGGGVTEKLVLDGIKGEATFINGNTKSNVSLKFEPGA